METKTIMEIMILIAAGITAIATVALSIFTWHYVKFTRELAEQTNKLVTETKRMVDQMNMADVAVFFRNEKVIAAKNSFIVFFCVKNVGTQFVRKVRIDVDPSFKDRSKVIADIKWVKNGINVLPPGEMFSYQVHRGSRPHEPETFYVNNKSKTEIKIRYEDIFKKEHSNDFTLDLHDIEDNPR